MPPIMAHAHITGADNTLDGKYRDTLSISLHLGLFILITPQPGRGYIISSLMYFIGGHSNKAFVIVT